MSSTCAKIISRTQTLSHSFCSFSKPKPVCHISHLFAGPFCDFESSKMEPVQLKPGVHFGTLILLSLKTFLLLWLRMGGPFWCPDLGVHGSGFCDCRWGLWHTISHRQLFRTIFLFYFVHQVPTNRAIIEPLSKRFLLLCSNVFFHTPSSKASFVFV